MQLINLYTDVMGEIMTSLQYDVTNEIRLIRHNGRIIKIMICAMGVVEYCGKEKKKERDTMVILWCFIMLSIFLSYVEFI